MRKFVLSVVFSVFIMYSNCQNVIDLSGKWMFKLDSLDKGVAERWFDGEFSEEIMLPGTTDLAQKGVKNSLVPMLQKPQLSHLTRKYRYVGVAWYAKEFDLDKNWKKNKVTLEMERVLWRTNVWVNGRKIEKIEESLVAPHRYEVSECLIPGAKNKIVVSVDNRRLYDITVDDMAHAYTDHTQIKWNGILGDITLTKHNPIEVSKLRVYPAADNKSVKVSVAVESNKAKSEEFKIELIENKTGNKVSEIREKRALKAGVSSEDFKIDNLSSIKEWNEFSPELYTIAVTVGDKTKNTEFGFRTIERSGNRMLINGKPLFLRGTLDCCVFPLTGTPPTEREGWESWLKTLKDWGINHVRFHSWCPPSAAFEVADRLGLYLQVELPLWSTTVKKDPALFKFLKSEGDRIFDEYGDHPSFCLFSLGNELQSDFETLGELLKKVNQNDGRQLYTTTSFTFEKGHGAEPEKADDFFVTQWTSKGWVRGQGVFNQLSPTFDKNFDASVEGINVPLVTHEIGQYSVYPDISEIEKYTGVLDPINFKAVKEDLEKKGLIGKADAYLKASGRLAAILYKEEVERAMKTDGISGFQLLSLSDFPGQGTALVGLLNAFGESKGVVSAEQFRGACAPVTPLMMFPKATYTNDENFSATFDVANYSLKDIDQAKIEWKAADDSGEVHYGGIIQAGLIKQAYNSGLGSFSVPLANITNATKLIFTAQIVGTEYKNSWSIWVYPKELDLNCGKVKYTRDYNEARMWLDKGESVLFNPDWKTIKGIEGKFVSVFWSPVHFPKQAGTMGILCDPKHPALNQFPTDFHTDWQWWDLNTKSTTLVVDSIKGAQPIVEMIDNFTNNRRLSPLFQGAVGKGKLVVCSIDLDTDLENRPAARQMLYSLLKYMNSGEFNPTQILNIDVLGSMINPKIENKASSAEAIYQ